MDWDKKETLECMGSELENIANALFQKYTTNIVLLKLQPISNWKYIVEVWHNYRSDVNVLNIILKEAVTDY